MRFLHTADWHVGKAMRGQSRLDEQQDVLAEIVEVARAEAVDAVLVVGDVFDTAMPSPDAQKLVWRTLLDLRATGADVIVVAGNHDNPWVFEALRPLASVAGITLLGQPKRPGAGGVVCLDCQSGEPLRIALVPFCSQRSVVRSAQLLAGEGAENAQVYAERVTAILGVLTASFSVDAVNLIVAHLMIRGGRLGGGERSAQTIEDYWVDPTAFGTSAHYVALGHLHLTQQLAGGCPIWYSGSPIQVDFGEEGDGKHVLIVDAAPGVPVASPRKVRLQRPRRLRTLRGSLSELAGMAGMTGDDLLRIYVHERARAGLADEVRVLYPNAVDVLIGRPDEQSDGPRVRSDRSRSPHELFGAYLADRAVDDDRLKRLFERLLDEETSAVAAGVDE
jgi:DNA repair protein SbcD/Mre11